MLKDPERVMITIDELAALELDAISARLLEVKGFKGQSPQDMMEKLGVALCEWWFQSEDEELRDILEVCRKDDHYSIPGLIENIRAMAGADKKIYPLLVEGIGICQDYLDDNHYLEEFYISDVEYSYTAEVMVFWINPT